MNEDQLWEEIDFLNQRVDNLTQVAIDLMNALGQHDLAARYIQFHNSQNQDLEKMRKARKK